jgi:hypothetical protein
MRRSEPQSVAYHQRRPAALARALALLCLLSLAGPRVARCLTPEEVLKLRAAGVSDDTIQKMIDQEEQQRIPGSMVEQSYATKHMGNWTLEDGSVVHSTGQSRQPFFDPTINPGQSSTQPYGIYPYVFPGAPGGAPAPARPPVTVR